MNIDFSVTPILPMSLSNELITKVVSHMESLGVPTIWSADECPFIGKYNGRCVILSAPADLTSIFVWYGITKLEVVLHEHIHALQHGATTKCEFRQANNYPLFQSMESFEYQVIMKQWKTTYPHSSRFLRHYKADTMDIEMEAYTYARLLAYHLGGYVTLEGEVLKNVNWLMTSLGIS